MANSDLSPWLLLQRLPGVGPITVQRLLDYYGDIHTLLCQPSQHLRAQGVPQAALSALDQWRQQPQQSQLGQQIEQDRHWLQQHQASALTLDNPDYPYLLKQIADPPLVLLISGDSQLLRTPQIAIVGSRKASQTGLRNSYQFARELGSQGFTITSGLALGIDAAAHRGALDSHSNTIAVLATGIDRIYPKQHQALAQQILEQGGTVVSEFPLGSEPKAGHFPRRNRIISGLSSGVLVVEASLRSGSLITAQQALEQGREVFALPGSIHAPASKGCHQLIRQGALLVEQSAHIIDEIGSLIAIHTEPTPPQVNTAPAPTPQHISASQPQETPTTQLLLDSIGYEPTSVEQILHSSGWQLDKLLGELLELELAGQIEQIGGLYQRC